MSRAPTIGAGAAVADAAGAIAAIAAGAVAIAGAGAIAAGGVFMLTVVKFKKKKSPSSNKKKHEKMNLPGGRDVDTSQALLLVLVLPLLALLL